MSTFQQFFPGGSSSGGGGGGVPATTTVAEVLVVAGGMSGGCWCCMEMPGSGGPGGAVLMSSAWNFEQGCPYTVTVGAGGPASSGSYYNAGGNSCIIGYNAPPTALVAHASVKTDTAQALTTYSPTHTVNGSTYHYGTSHGTNTLMGPWYNWGSPMCFVVGGSAGGAGNPGCPANGFANLYSASCYCMAHLCRVPGREGVGSNISGTMTYYGPGGHGWSGCLCGMAGGTALGQDGGMWFDCSGEGMRRPTLSCSGCSGGTSNVIASCANYGAGGAGSCGNCGGCNAGGSGVVFIRYPDDYPAAAGVSGNISTPAQPGYHVYRWNGSGSITF